MSRTRRFFTVVSILVFCMAFAMSLYAQSSPVDSVNDLVTHKFHPKNSPITQTGVANETGSVVTLQPSAIAEMQALVAEKKSRNATQLKINSNVLATARMMQGQPVAQGVDYLETNVDLDVNDNIVVDISARVSDSLLERMKDNGARIIGSWPNHREIRAAIPAAKIETIAAFPEVKFVSTMKSATTWSERKGATRGNVSTYVANAITAIGTGSLISEGDKAHKADVARSTYGVSGVGIKIGVLSDGVNSLAVSQSLGELGPVTVLEGQAGDGDEGTAMLEIIHDLAPSAKLYFATAFGGSASFADNIRALREAGCDIIVDDVSYYLETRFQDGQDPEVESFTNSGIVVQAVNDVVADGAFYFSSAANSGNQDDKTSGAWEGDFADGGYIPGVGSAHLWTAGSTFNKITGSTGWIVLSWSDPIGASTNDYDLYILDSTASHVAASSTMSQNVTNPFEPMEWFGGSVPPGYLIFVVKYDPEASPRYLHLSTNRGTIQYGTFGATYGHNSGKNTFSVAATPARWAFGTGWPVGPFPGVFSATNHVELFSSDGPRRIFFNADGTPITAGNFSATGGEMLKKPDFTAADGVSVTGVGGFGSPFYGTSAASPHAAAIAALLKSARPSIDLTGMKNALANSAIDIQGAGWDRNSGTGILMADAAIASLGTNANANIDLGSVVATENPGNRNGSIEPGEGVKMVVSLHNKLGAAGATAIKATLTSATPGVTIHEPSTVSYDDLAAKAGEIAGKAPFLFTIASDFPPCSGTIDFNLSVEFAGGTARVLPFTIPVGLPPVLVNTTLNPGTMPTIAGVVTAKGTQNGRVFRTAEPTSCSTTPKPFPGLGGAAGQRAYDAYTFTACRDVCATVSMNDPNNGGALYTSIYSGTFDPTNIGTNFIGDSGASYISQPYSAQLTSGGSYTVIVNEVNPNTAVGASYTLQLPACALNCAVPNQVPIARAKNVTVDANPLKVVAVNVNNGSSDPDGDALTITQTPPGPYPIGTTNVVLTVVDTKGATAQANAVVTVNPIPTVTYVNVLNIPEEGNLTFGDVTVKATVVAGFGSDYTGKVKFTVDGTTSSSQISLDYLKTASWTFRPSIGAHTIVAEYSGDANYATSTSAAAAFTIDTAPSKVTLTKSRTSTAFGESVTFTATIAGITGGTAATGNVDFMEGTTVLHTSALTNGVATFTTTALVRGDHDLKASYVGDANYPAAVSALLTHTVTAADYSVSASPSSLTITRGNTGTSTITVTPIGTFSGTVTLTCGTLPQYATCSFSSTTVSPTTSAVTSVLTINTKSTTTSAALSNTMPIFAMLSLVLPGLLVLPVRRNKKLKYILWTALFVLAIAMLLGTVACGGSSTPAPAAPPTTPTTAAGTYTVPVTVAGGGQSHPVTVTVTVQ